MQQLKIDIPRDQIEAFCRRWKIVELSLFDVFRGDQLGPGRRSLAYRLRFNAVDHTLTDDEVAEVRGRCIAAVETQCAATLRG